MFGLDDLVETAVSELFQVVKDAIATAAMFKTELEKLQSTLESITPTFRDIERSNRKLDLPEHEMEKFKQILEKGKKLVEKCSTVDQRNWDYWIKRYRYTKRLQELDSSIVRFMQVDMQLQITRDVKFLRLETDEWKRIGIETLEALKERGNFSRSRSETGSDGFHSPPDPPKVTFGLDAPLKDIKKDLSKEGVQVIVVSAPGGYGKTTLVRKLCKDCQIIAKFKDNIFYVTVSQTFNVKLVIQNIFNHKNRSLPEEVQTDKEAFNKLEQLLKEIGSEPILLVLDDVWRTRESDTILKNFKFELPDYKILVTSRSKFPQFGSGHNLEPLNEEDARRIFLHSALLPDGNPYSPDEDIIIKIVKSCKGSPLALTVVGGSLCGKPADFWKKREKELTQVAKIFHDDKEILNCLQSSLDVLDDEIKECYMDLGSFPEDQRIPATAFIDMWKELYELDEDHDVIINLYELFYQSLVHLTDPRKHHGDNDNYDNFFVTQHDLLRDLVIYQSNLGQVEDRKRLFLEIRENDFPRWWLEQKQHPIKARLMSIATDENFLSCWLNLEAPEVEAVVLNIRSEKYTLPTFFEKMNKTKVLIVTNNGIFHAELSNFQLLGSLPDLKRIRLEHVSIPSFDMKMMQMKNLQKISLFRCNVGHGFENHTFCISHTCPNLKEIDIDYCNDLKRLPDKLCEIVSITRLRITNCHKLFALPQEIGKLVNLQVLKLTSCTDLEALPDTTGNLSNLNFLDISECLSIKELPTKIGELCSLKTLCMKGCSSCKLPPSIRNLKSLKVLNCDEETAYNWKPFKSYLSDLRIEKVEEDINAFIQQLPNVDCL